MKTRKYAWNDGVSPFASIVLFLLLTTAACSVLQQIETPEDRYYVLTQAVTEVARDAIIYVDDCRAGEINQSCLDNLPKINAAAKVLDKSMDETDRVFVTHDSQYYDLSLSATQNALVNLGMLLEGKHE